tara:strand:+ start:212 stop:331 length:120 start_codon:yes stop_codon:yes gene_type:complete
LRVTFEKIGNLKFQFGILLLQSYNPLVEEADHVVGVPAL